MITKDKTCETEMFLGEHETEHEKEQEVVDEGGCLSQPGSVVACPTEENSKEQEHDKKKICLLFSDVNYWQDEVR